MGYGDPNPALQQQINNDPALQAFLQKYRASNFTTDQQKIGYVITNAGNLPVASQQLLQQAISQGLSVDTLSGNLTQNGLSPTQTALVTAPGIIASGGILAGGLGGLAGAAASQTAQKGLGTAVNGPGGNTGPGGTNVTSPSGTFNPASLAALIPLIMTALNKPSQPNPGQLIGSVPGGQDILNSVLQQNAQKAPLRTAVTQQAMNMLPNSAFPGGRPTTLPTGPSYAPAAQPSGSSGGISPALTALIAGLSGYGIGASPLGSSLANWLKSIGAPGPGFPTQSNPPPGGVVGSPNSNTVSPGYQPPDPNAPGYGSTYDPNDPTNGTSNPGDFTGE